MQQLLAETFLLTIVGSAVGIALGWAALKAAIPLMPDAIPSWVSFRLDFRFAAFTLVLMTAVTAMAGLWPAVEFSKTDVRQALGEAAPKSSLSAARRRSLNALVIGEVALAVILLSAGGLVLKAFHRVAVVDPGFQPHNAMTFAVNPPYLDSQQRKRYYRGILEALQATPGIESVGQSNMPPWGDASVERGVFHFKNEGEPDQPLEQHPLALQRIVMPGYFRAMGIAFKSGRDFDDRDRQPTGTRSMIVNEEFVRQFWTPGSYVVGKQVVMITLALPIQIVGVVSDVHYQGLDRPVEPWFYLCQTYAGSTESPFHTYFIVRGKLEQQALVALARQVTQKLDPGLAIYEVRTMRDWMERSLGPRRAYSWLFTIFAGVGLLLAVAGIDSVVSFTVTRRTREIGIRVALGAGPSQVVGEVIRGTMTLVAIGIAIGLAGAWFASRAMTSVLAGLSPHDPWAYAVVIVVLSLSVLLATLLTARRAAFVDPVRALRQE